MSNDAFIIICLILIAAPFIVSCIKGKPFIGVIAGIASFLAMGFAANNGIPMLGVHLIGLVIAGIGIGHPCD